MTEKKVLKAEGVGGLIGAITALLGYMPTQSLVIAPFRGARAEGAIRVNLPTGADAYPALVSQVLGITCRVPDVTGFAAVIYTDDNETAHEELAAALLHSALFVGLDVAALAFLTPTSWGEYFDGAAHPLDALPALPGPGLVRDGDQTAAASLPAPDEALRLALLSAFPIRPEDVDVCALFEEVPSWDVAALEAEKLGALIDLVALPLFRDVALVQWATSAELGRDALAEQEAHRDGAPVSERIGRGRGRAQRACRALWPSAASPPFTPPPTRTERPCSPPAGGCGGRWAHQRPRPSTSNAPRPPTRP